LSDLVVARVLGRVDGVVVQNGKGHTLNDGLTLEYIGMKTKGSHVIKGQDNGRLKIPGTDDVEEDQTSNRTQSNGDRQFAKRSKLGGLTRRHWSDGGRVTQRGGEVETNEIGFGATRIRDEMSRDRRELAKLCGNRNDRMPDEVGSDFAYGRFRMGKEVRSGFAYGRFRMGITKRREK
jgi:hypothetical protein